MNSTDWATLSDALRILSPVLGGWAIVLLRQILTQLRTLNGRVTRLEDWKKTHDTTEHDRFADLRREMEQTRERVLGPARAR